MSSAPIYLGFWSDYSRGLISGSTLTVSHQSGFYLISFLALFVRLVGGHLWTIICFILHQFRTTTTSQDGLHHQHQFLLRNSQSNTSTIWDLTKVAWGWRSAVKHSFARTFPLLALAITHTVLITAAAFFSSLVASSSNLVLIQNNPACGYLQYPSSVQTLSDTKQALEWQIATKASSKWALDYVNTCYNGSSSNTLCNSLVHRALDLKTSVAECPFPNTTICLDEGFQVDTGYINSAEHLGINSKPEDSIDYRRVTTCAPIVMEDYWYENTTVNATVEGDREYNLNYGWDLVYGSVATFTFNYFDLLARAQAYLVSWTHAEAGDLASSLFIPIEGLNRTDGDVSLIMLYNFARYLEPVEDAWYKATIEFDHVYQGTPRYRARYPYVSVMGCVTQHELCFGYPRTCPGLAGMSPVEDRDISGKRQLVIAQHLWNALSATTLPHMFKALGSDALLAESGLTGAQHVEHIGLPDKQWQKEVLLWAQHAVINIQKLLRDYVAGPTSPDSVYLIKPDSVLSEEFDVCGAQMIRDSETYSINVFGLVFTIVTGVIIVLINFCLPTIVGVFQKRSGLGHHRYEAYKLDNALQVQRMAYENLGLGHWGSMHAMVPITGKGEMFGKPTKGMRASAELRRWSEQQFMAPFNGQYSMVYQTPYADSTRSMSVQESDPFLASKARVGPEVREMI